MDFLTTGSNFILILAGFCFLIVIHELGHFVAARWAGIRVEGFSVGMGPAVLSYRSGIGLRLGSTDRETVRRFGRPAIAMKDHELAMHGIGETEYALRAFPLGGFVRMLGQDDAAPASIVDAPRSFQNVPISKRMIVVSAGVVFNLILALVLFLIAFLVGVRFEAPIVGNVSPQWMASTAVATNAKEAGLPADGPKGLRAGDRILSIDGEPTLSFMDVQLGGGLAKPDRSVNVIVERPGVATPLVFELIPNRDQGSGLLSFGFDPSRSTTITTERESREAVAKVLDTCGLAQHGVKPGMRLVEVNGTPVHTGQEVDSIVDAGHGAPVSTVWQTQDGTVVKAPLLLRAVFVAQSVPSGDPEGSKVEYVYEYGLAGLISPVAIGFVDESSVNMNALRDGDVLLKVGALDAPTFVKLRRELAAHRNQPIDLVVLREGREVRVVANVDRDGKLGIVPAVARDTRLLAGTIGETVLPGNTKSDPAIATPTPAAGADVFPRSEVTRVADAPVANWTEIREQLKAATASALAAKTGAEVTIEVLPPLANSAAERVTLKFSADDVRALHKLGWTSQVLATFDPEFVTLKANGPIEAISMGLTQTKKMVMQVYLTLDRVARRSVSVEQLNGPVGILHAGVRVADRGFMFLIFFLAAISVNLAVMNFLPLPIVDGGLFLYLVYEKIRGKPPSIAFQNVATAVGLMLIGSIFLITFFNDLRRLVG